LLSVSRLSIHFLPVTYTARVICCSCINLALPLTYCTSEIRNVATLVFHHHLIIIVLECRNGSCLSFRQTQASLLFKKWRSCFKFRTLHFSGLLPLACSGSELILNKSSDVGIALGYGLDDRGSRVRFPAGAGNFSLHHRLQNGSGAHPASYSMGTRGSFPGGKVAGA
jgi:hypothetical protein